MALVVEDGSGLTNADSYLSLADADTYWAAHGTPAAWTGATTDEKEAGLRLGTQFLDIRFLLRWKGTRWKWDQALDWPRHSVIDEDGFSLQVSPLPRQLKDATPEAALRSIEDTILIPDTQASSGIIMQRDHVGTLETETRFSSAASVDEDGNPVKRYRIIDQMLYDLIDTADRLHRG